MRIPFLPLFMRSPLDGIQEHAEKVKECTWAFQQAIECHLNQQCQSFEEHRKEVVNLENEADIIKRRVRTRMSRQFLMPFDKFQIFMYLGEQDHILNAVEESLAWLSYRPTAGIPAILTKETNLLVDAVIEPIEELVEMVDEARRFFRKPTAKQRGTVIDRIRNLRLKEHEADRAENLLKQKIFTLNLEATDLFYMIRFAEIVGTVADHAEKAGDIMRAMIAG
ncbi:MAG: TIGR00153 family protein [Thermodesulfobacteriota bacterium]